MLPGDDDSTPCSNRAAWAPELAIAEPATGGPLTKEVSKRTSEQPAVSTASDIVVIHFDMADVDCTSNARLEFQ